MHSIRTIARASKSVLGRSLSHLELVSKFAIDEY